MITVGLSELQFPMIQVLLLHLILVVLSWQVLVFLIWFSLLPCLLVLIGAYWCLLVPIEIGLNSA